jgi:hypothetical protein
VGGGLLWYGWECWMDRWVVLGVSYPPTMVALRSTLGLDINSSSVNISIAGGDEPVKLSGTVVMAKAAKAEEDAVAADVERLQGAIQVNSNEQIMVFESDEQRSAVTEEDILALGKSKKKAKRVGVPRSTPPSTAVQ